MFGNWSLLYSFFVRNNYILSQHLFLKTALLMLQYDLVLKGLCIFLSLAEPLDGQWSEWSQWSKCPKKCGIPSGTFITRTRRCNSPPAMSGGKPCQGNATEAVKSCFSPCAGMELLVKRERYLTANWKKSLIFPWVLLLSFLLSFCLSVYQPVCLSVCLSTWLPVYPSVNLQFLVPC